jgi:serine/threonine protein kinase
MAELKKGTTLQTTTAKNVKIQQKIGEGGQGVVYKVSYNGKPKALKWYKGNAIKSPEKFYENLENNIRKGAPTDSFLWPEDITEKSGGDFGYIMDLRPAEYKDFSLFLLAKEKFASVTAMTNTGLQIIEAFRELHNSGYSYQDLNDGNFFVNPKTGDVLICDNDNVSEYGKNLGIAGKCRYMAPEIVLGKALPSVHTDKFSLAVVLFLLLMNNHPLEGKRSYPPCTTEALERKIYGEEPLFIFNKDDDSNAPLPGINNNAIKRWPLYPSYIREKFLEGFSRDALMDPSKRIIEKDWLRLFMRLRSEIFKCPSCGDIFFADATKATTCPACGKIHIFEHHIALPKMNIALHERTKFFEYQTDPDSDNYKTLTAELVRNETTGAPELKNRSKKTWLVIGRDGRQVSKSPGKTVPLESCAQIIFGM